jgi:hypothetical protein
LAIPWAIWQGTIAVRVEAKMLLGHDVQAASILTDNHRLGGDPALLGRLGT